MAGKRTIVHGVGVNDANYQVVKRTALGKLCCPYYDRWHGMIRRCYEKSISSRNITYAGCSVCDDWLLFSNFKSWMEQQDWQGNELDKDIITPGNKVYSPENCAFISPDLNKFTNDYRGRNGDHPLGVSYKKQSGKFVARCRNPFTKKEVHLGYFKSSDDAHLAWKRSKHEIACAYASMQNDLRVASSLLSRYA